MKTDKKIEEIYMDTLKLTDDEWVAKYGEGNGYHEAFETLIQQEREEAVEGFAKYLERRNKDWFCGLLEGIYLLRAKRYLQSLDKGDKITSNTLTITEEELENASYTSSTIESEGK